MIPGDTLTRCLRVAMATEGALQRRSERGCFRERVSASPSALKQALISFGCFRAFRPQIGFIFSRPQRGVASLLLLFLFSGFDLFRNWRFLAPGSFSRQIRPPYENGVTGGSLTPPSPSRLLRRISVDSVGEQQRSLAGPRGLCSALLGKAAPAPPDVTYMLLA